MAGGGRTEKHLSPLYKESILPRQQTVSGKSGFMKRCQYTSGKSCKGGEITKSPFVDSSRKKIPGACTRHSSDTRSTEPGDNQWFAWAK